MHEKLPGILHDLYKKAKFFKTTHIKPAFFSNFESILTRSRHLIFLRLLLLSNFERCLFRCYFFVGNGFIEGSELDSFLREFVSSVNKNDAGPEVRMVELQVWSQPSIHIYNSNVQIF